MGLKAGQDLSTYLPFGFYEWVDVSFTTADQDVVVGYHEIKAQDPELVRFLVVSITKGGVVYRDGSATRVAWQQGMVRLRCSAANASARILLFVEASHV